MKYVIMLSFLMLTSCKYLNNAMQIYFNGNSNDLTEYYCCKAEYDFSNPPHWNPLRTYCVRELSYRYGRGEYTQKICQQTLLLYKTSWTELDKKNNITKPLITEKLPDPCDKNTDVKEFDKIIDQLKIENEKSEMEYKQENKK